MSGGASKALDLVPLRRPAAFPWGGVE